MRPGNQQTLPSSRVNKVVILRLESVLSSSQVFFLSMHGKIRQGSKYVKMLKFKFQECRKNYVKSYCFLVQLSICAIFFSRTKDSANY